MPDRRAWRALTALALLAPLAGGGPAHAARPPGCSLVLVSPAFTRDRTVACVHRAGSNTPFLLAVSTDRGRGWRTPAMTGLVRAPDHSGDGLTVALSPTFGTDRTLFAVTSSGTFLSTDLGETFALVDSVTAYGGTHDDPVPFVGRDGLLPVGDGKPTLLLADAGRTGVAGVVDVPNRTRRPVLGVPGHGAAQFVVPDAATAPAGTLALSRMGTPAGGRLVVYRCDAALTCAEPLFTFPAGVGLSPDTRLRRLPDGSLIVLLPSTPQAPVWRSTDGGRTFAEWRPVTALVTPVNASGGSGATLSFASSPALPRRLYLRIDKTRPRDGWPKSAPPASQLFRSDDAGASWRRVGYGLGSGQRGRRGNLPWGAWFGEPHLALAPDGRLFAPGPVGAIATTFCSVDGGKRWTAGCPR